MKNRLKNVFSGFAQKVNNGMNSLSMTGQCPECICRQ